MPREAEPSINERAFILQALQEGVRLDGRPLDAFRDVDISFGDEYGLADVQLGKTRYVTLLEEFDKNERLAATDYVQSLDPHFRQHNSSLPRQKIRRRLHYHNRALTSRIPRLRSRPVSSLLSVRHG